MKIMYGSDSPPRELPQKREKEMCQYWQDMSGFPNPTLNKTVWNELLLIQLSLSSNFYVEYIIDFGVGTDEVELFKYLTT